MAIFLIQHLLRIPLVLVAVSALLFFLLQLQPGGFLNQYLEDPRFSPETVAAIERQFGLDQPPVRQYLNWVWGIVTEGNFGYSFLAGRPVASLIGEAMAWTIVLVLTAAIFTWLVAVPLGILTAVYKDRFWARTADLVSYLGLAIPDFFLALVLVALVLQSGGSAVGGLFSPAYVEAPWSLARLGDLINHLWIPVLALSLEGIATLTRQTRASLLEVLDADYVRTARAKGLNEFRVIVFHAFRNALNPLVVLAGLWLPGLIGSSIVVSKLLSIPAAGPLLYDSLVNKDQYLAMSLVLLLAALLMLGNLLADLALARLDPRVRYG